MVNRLQSWIFMAIALVTMSWGMLPIVRVAFGLDEKLSGSYIWSVSFMIGGLMCGLTAMLLMVRKQADISAYTDQSKDKTTAAQLHASGLLIFSGIPFANFFVCYFLWVSNRGKSAYLDYQGREAICFQISIYLYLMMCLFLAYIIVGALAVPLVLAFHLLATITAVTYTLLGKEFSYPANISIIARAPN
ncbi:MAG: putative Tic20 family protein [Cryomorphaceae bacterium]|jgi:uncharacterized Tic20 family protein